MDFRTDRHCIAAFIAYVPGMRAAGERPVGETPETPKAEPAPVETSPKIGGANGEIDSWEEFLELMGALLRAGQLSRPLGAFFMLLFVYVLAKIPAVFLTGGVRLLRGVLSATNGVWERE